MEFAEFMASPLDRALRVVAGLIILYLVLSISLGLVGILIGVVLTTPGAFNFYDLSKLFGGPSDGHNTKQPQQTTIDLNLLAANLNTLVVFIYV